MYGLLISSPFGMSHAPSCTCKLIFNMPRGLACVVRVCAHSTARFCVPGSNNGGFCHTPGVALANKIHPRRALAMLLLAEPIDVDEALQVGLVTKITESLYGYPSPFLPSLSLPLQIIHP